LNSDGEDDPDSLAGLGSSNNAERNMLPDELGSIGRSPLALGPPSLSSSLRRDPEPSASRAKVARSRPSSSVAARLPPAVGSGSGSTGLASGWAATSSGALVSSLAVASCSV